MEQIKEVVSKAVEALAEHGYGVTMQKKREYSFLRILRLHERHNKEQYDEALVSGYISECETRFKRGEIVWERYRELTKAAEQLVQIYEQGKIIPNKRSFAPELPTYYYDLQWLISQHPKWSYGERKDMRYFMNKFFKWLISHNHDTLRTVDEKVIRNYFIYCADYLTGCGLDKVRHALKKALSYFAEIGVIADPFSRIFSFAVPIDKKIHPGIPHSEIAATLKTIDRSTVQGKRDYAIILTAVVTGLRAVDLAGLEIGSIDWNCGEIRLVQSKTRKSIALPLTTDAGKAVRDYIVNARPVCSIRNVFLTLRAPIRAFSSTNITVMHNRYRQQAGLPLSGIHGLRRALGSGMVSAFVSITTAMQVLGQTELNSTKPYMALNRTQLKECALSFAGIEPNRGDA